MEVWPLASVRPALAVPQQPAVRSQAVSWLPARLRLLIRAQTLRAAQIQPSTQHFMLLPNPLAYFPQVLPGTTPEVGQPQSLPSHAQASQQATQCAVLQGFMGRLGNVAGHILVCPLLAG